VSRKIFEHTYKDKNVLVVGLGTFTGGVATTRFFISRGANVTVTDLKPGRELGESALEVIGLGARCHFGGHVEQDFREADIVVLNPAVKPGFEYLRAVRPGCLVTTETALFFRMCPARIVGITGTNGKSTTAALVGHMLETAGMGVFVGGNIGNALIDRVHEIRADDVVVLELSSFQLHRLGEEMLSPQVAVITNLAPNHLDWHGTFRHYRDGKANILRYQNAGDFKVINFDDDESDYFRAVGDATTLGFSLRHKLPQGAWIESGKIGLHVHGATEWVDCLDRIPMPGRHNTANVLAAAAAARAVGAPAEAIEAAVPTFTPLEHRLEPVGEVNGVRFINDSIATTPESAVMALESFDEPKVIIAGGYDKKVPLSEFSAAIAHRAKAAVLVGQTAAALKAGIEAVKAENKCETAMAATFEEAFSRAVAFATAGDVVLLSPGCASYGMFANFVERGQAFKELVRELPDASHVRL